jgi:integrase
MAVFKKQGVYWIDYYVNGRRKRERIGPDKKLAEVVLKKRKVEIAEGKYLDRQRPITSTFNDLATAYLSWISPDEQTGTPARKRTWNTGDAYAISKLRVFFAGQRLTAITPDQVEHYRAWRRASLSRFRRQVMPATVNRELAVLRHMFNVTRKGVLRLKGGAPPENPVSQVAFEREHNERDRVLSAEEFTQVYQAAVYWLKPMALLAYQTGMRRGEIVHLRWDQVDLTRGIIRLRSSDTKTHEARVIPMTLGIRDVLSLCPRGVGASLLFLSPATGRPYTPAAVSLAFQRACRQAGITGATFHDLRHTFVTNARRAGIDYFRIMAMTGHKTLRMFQRYNLVDEQDLREAISQLDTYMDTSATEGSALRRKYIVHPGD